MATTYVSSGVTSSGLTIGGGDEMIVFSGGLAQDTAVEGNGTQVVFGTALATTVQGSIENSAQVSGFQVVSSGGLASGVTILSNGYENVEKGGVATGVTISAHEFQNVYSGGRTLDVTITSGGAQTVYKGASASAITVDAGYDDVSGSVTSTILSGEDSMNALQYVDSGGVVVSATLLSGSDETVKAGGVVDHATIDGGGWQLVEGVAEREVIGGSLVISGNQEASSVAYQGVAFRGRAIGIAVLSGGQEEVENGGSATTVTVAGGGLVVVDQGGSVSDITVKSGGELLLNPGAVYSNVTVLPGGLEAFDQTVSSGQTVSGFVVGYDGSQTVLRGGLALSTTVDAGGFQDVFGTASAGTLKGLSGGQTGGFQQIEARGVASGFLVQDGATQYVRDGGKAVGTVLGGGPLPTGSSDDFPFAYQFAESGSVVAHTTVLAGGDDLVESGSLAESILVASGGRLSVHPHASASGVVVSSGGTLVAWNDDTLDKLTLRSGAIELYDHEVFSGAVLKGQAVTSGEALDVDSGGVASGAVVGAGAEEDVYGTDDAAILRGAVSAAAGTVDVSVGYQLIEGGSALGALVSSGGVQSLSYGVAKDTRVFNGGLAEVDDGLPLGPTSAVDMEVGSGGELIVNDGGVIVNLTLKPGALVDLAGVAATSVSVVSGHLVAFSAGVALESLGLKGGGAGLTFSVGPDGQGGADIHVSAGGESGTAPAPSTGPLFQAVAAFRTDVAGLAPSEAIEADAGVHANLSRAVSLDHRLRS